MGPRTRASFFSISKSPLYLWNPTSDTLLTISSFANYSEEFLTGAQSLFLFNSISSKTDTGLY